MKKLIKYSGFSVIAGGVFLILTNAILTPFMNLDDPLAEIAKTSIFFYRMSSAAITVSLLLFGTIGLHLNQIKNSNNFGNIAFILAFFGSAFLLSNEWYQIFVLPELAKNSPDALMSLDSSEGMSKYDIGAMIAIFSFSIGWILFSISMLKAKVYSRLGPILIISGFFITPIFSSFLSPVWASAIGNTVMGFAFCLLGREIIIFKNEP